MKLLAPPSCQLSYVPLEWQSLIHDDHMDTLLYHLVKSALECDQNSWSAIISIYNA